MQNLAILILLLPAITALIAGTFAYLIPATKTRDNFAMGITTGGLIIAAISSVVLFNSIALHDAATINITLFNWLETATFQVNFGIMVDKLTATMLIVVTLVSACVHVYSIGYMENDPSKTRFFAYLSFFTFAMLALVMAPNLFQMFLGWEGVGVASYLLIGFWHQKATANTASVKAFITNRVADAAMLIGLFMIIDIFGSLNYTDIFAQVESVNTSTINLIALMLFLGAMGKSAQFGFHVWLPDAMEGPTPVSALIHAATMVTAGVFLLCRMSPLFEYAESVLTLVAWVGALTAIFAATVGLTQTDIKRVIAYSTCSQLGYMFFAIGVSAYPAAMFHLTTHAFFKALLFLGAGSVIHAMHHQQNMFKMGALFKLLPITYGLMWVGSLALSGIPPFAGFFSKDLILESALGANTETGMWLYLIGTIGALLTAFYSFRVLFLTFHNTYKGEKKVLDHAHESPLAMLIPMLFLGVGAIFAGWFLHDMASIEWWAGSLKILEHHPAIENAHHTAALAKYAPLVLVVIGISIAALMYFKKSDWPKILVNEFEGAYKFSLNKWFVDEFYSKFITRPVANFATKLWRIGDEKWIDGIGVNGTVDNVLKVSNKLSGWQTGYVYHYAFAIVTGLCILITWLVLKNV